MGTGARSGLWSPIKDARLTRTLVKQRLNKDDRTRQGKPDTALTLRIELAVSGHLYLLTLARLRLEAHEGWDPDRRERINRTASEERGRVLYCVVDELPLAAIAFSLKGGKSRPLLAYASASRTEPDLQAESVVALWRPRARVGHPPHRPGRTGCREHALLAPALKGRGCLRRLVPLGAPQEVRS